MDGWMDLWFLGIPFNFGQSYTAWYSTPGHRAGVLQVVIAGITVTHFHVVVPAGRLVGWHRKLIVQEVRHLYARHESSNTSGRYVGTSSTTGKVWTLVFPITVLILLSSSSSFTSSYIYYALVYPFTEDHQLQVDWLPRYTPTRTIVQRSRP